MSFLALDKLSDIIMAFGFALTLVIGAFAILINVISSKKD